MKRFLMITAASALLCGQAFAQQAAVIPTPSLSATSPLGMVPSAPVGGTGIPLGDRNTVESGLYVTAGTKVALLDEHNQLVKVVKARELAGQPDLLFRRNSQTGAVECKTHKSAIELNEALHAHN